MASHRQFVPSKKHAQCWTKLITHSSALFGAAASIAASGCVDRAVGESSPETHNVFLTRERLSKIEKIDVLFMIDNSLSMGDKQTVLAAAVPQLLRRLTSPDCVNTKDKSAEPVAMADPNTNCPSEAFQREFAPVKDIHIGIVTSSLGDFGGNACATTNEDGSTDPVLQGRDDQAWLLGSLPRTQGAFGSPFLSWSPADAKDFTKRIGEAESQFRNFVTATGELGCGMEMSLESWYRFLIDPEPPISVDLLVHEDRTAVTARNPKVDDALLAQRKQFLRPDSLLAIVMLTDENDCSLRDSGLSWLMSSASGRLEDARKGASAACEKSPNDPCCYSCDINNPPTGCKVEPNCTGATPTKDVPNLRCFDQKRRYGYDFLFPTSRYVNALRLPTICPYQNYGTLDCDCKEEKKRGITDCVAGKSFKNPIFDPEYAGVASNVEGRTDPDLVFLAGIVGVPWQDIAEPDTAAAGKNLRYQVASRIDWDLILPRADGTPARDPLMREQIEPRSGTHPITNEPLGLPTSPNQRQLNSINWHDWEGDGKELQYACVFDISQPLSDASTSGARDCDATCASDDKECAARREGCPCTNKVENDPKAIPIYPKSPLCQASDGSYGKMQYAAKAYPGIRELEVLKGHNATVTDNSIVASICPKDLDWNHRRDSGYGYNPAVQSLVDRLKTKLVSTCLPRTLEVEGGKVPCAVIEAVPPSAKEWQDCEAKGRDRVDDKLRNAVLAGMRADQLCDSPGRPACSDFGTCQLRQLTDDDPNQPLTQCQTKVGYESSSPVPGFCYVDPAEHVGAEELVQQCPNNRKRVLRIVGNGDDLRAPAPNSWTFVSCAGAPFMKK